MNKKRIFKKKVAEKPVDLIHLKTILLRSISEMYPKDESSPGVVESYLTNGNFYISICRYDAVMGRAKQVLLSAQAETYEKTLTEIVEKWTRSTESSRKLAVLSKQLC